MAYQRQSFSGDAVPTTLANTIQPTDLTITVQSLVGYPDTAVGPFVITVDRGTTNEEKILIDSYTGNILTVDPNGRGYDSTTAVQHTAGADLRHTISAEVINNHETFVAGNGTVAPTASAVGDASSNGSSSVPAAADHQHARESFVTGVTSASEPGDTEFDGTSASPARADHRHAREAAAEVETPVGAIVMWPTNNLPTNWLSLDGQTVSGGVATYPELAAVCPSSWISGSDLVLPNMAGVFPIGAGTDYSVGSTGGATSSNVTLTTGEIPQFADVAVSISDPSHSHVAPGGNQFWVTSGSDTGQWAYDSGNQTDAMQFIGANTEAAATGITGTVTFGSASPTPVNVPIIPPYMAFNFIVKAA